MIYGLGAQRMTGIPFLAGVATFFFKYSPTQTLGLIHHTVIVYDSMVLYLLSLICYTVWSLMRHKDKSTFTSCKNRWHYIPHLTVECKKNVITNESITACEKETTTSFPWLGVHVLKCSSLLNSTESRRHKLYQKDLTRHQNDTLSRVLLAQGGSISYIL